MTDWTCLRAYLPAEWVDALEVLPPSVGDSVQEIRIRADGPVCLSLPAENRLLGNPPLRCSSAQLEDCYLRFCRYTVYAHEWELSRGYLSVPGGIRVGVAGRAIMEGERVRTVGDVTSLCVRIPREMAGCSARLQRLVTPSGYPESALLVGPPSAGKTTLLRDLAVGMAKRFRVAVVDERGELSGLNPLVGCDVLVGYPKAVGLHQAVRCLAPDVVLFDELGTTDEVNAVTACAHAGVAVIATLHGYDSADVVCRPLTEMLINHRVFSRWVFLAGRRTPGALAGCFEPEVKENEIHWLPVDCTGGCRDGTAAVSSFDRSGGVFASDGTPVRDSGASTGIHPVPYGAIVGKADRYAGVF